MSNESAQDLACANGAPSVAKQFHAGQHTARVRQMRQAIGEPSANAPLPLPINLNGKMVSTGKQNLFFC